MELVDPLVIGLIMHPAVQPVEPGVKADEIGGIFKHDHPPGRRLVLKRYPAMRLQPSLRAAREHIEKR